MRLLENCLASPEHLFECVIYAACVNAAYAQRRNKLRAVRAESTNFVIKCCLKIRTTRSNKIAFLIVTKSR